MSFSFSIPFSSRDGLRPLSRLRAIWTDLRRAQTIATEFAALNALSDSELARMGLTRAVLKRHLHQKHYAHVLGSRQGGWHDTATPDHGTRKR